jgi:hypothetical protein
MTIDETAERLIPLPVDQVAGYAMDWRNDANWTQGIRSAELTKEADEGGFGVGAEVTRTAHFLGRRIDYVLRVAAYEPGRVLDVVSVAGPMPMHVTYTFAPHPQSLCHIPGRAPAAWHARSPRCRNAHVAPPPLSAALERGDPHDDVR